VKTGKKHPVKDRPPENQMAAMQGRLQELLEQGGGCGSRSRRFPPTLITR
jgi:hypothetical protein